MTVILVGAASACVKRRLPRHALPLLVYLAVYVLAGLHTAGVGNDELARYYLRPLVAVALVVTPLGISAVRRLIAAIVIGAALETLVAAVQSIRLVVRYGRHATTHVDGVTGTLGVGQAGVVALYALLAACFLVGPWLMRKRGGVALPLAGVAMAVVAGAATSTRADVAIIPAVALAACVFLLLAARAPVGHRRVAAVVAGGALAVPLLYAATVLAYPGAFTGGLSSQDSVVLVGPAGPQPVPAKHPASHPKPTPAPTAAPRSGVQLLPGRFAQLRLAARSSADAGVDVFLIGRGPGSADLDPKYTDPTTIPLPQRTGSTWAGRVLTECGWLGIAALIALLVWLALLGAAVARRGVETGAALPFVAALTGIAALYTTVLDVRAYSIPFWLIVGLAARLAVVTLGSAWYGPLGSDVDGE